MKELYRQIGRLDMDADNELITITGGEMAGLQILLKNGSQIWSSEQTDPAWSEKVDPKDIFREKLTRNLSLVVCGCGFVGQSVIRLAKFLGWQVSALDDRETFTGKAQEAGADKVICGEFGTSLAQISSDSSTCFVIVTREHQYDRACLEKILRMPSGYVGMMGSHKRVAILRESLVNDGFDAQKVAQIRGPVGLPIGAQTPEEIAVSIIAQIIEERAASFRGTSFPDTLSDALKDLCAGKQRAVMAVIISREGSTPRQTGTRMLVYPDGHTAGTIGGGLMEAEVIRQSVDALKDPDAFSPRTITVDLSGRPGAFADMVCGGITKVFLELL